MVLILRPQGGRRPRPLDLPFTAGHARRGTHGGARTARPEPMRNSNYQLTCSSLEVKDRAPFLEAP